MIVVDIVKLPLHMPLINDAPAVHPQLGSVTSLSMSPNPMVCPISWRTNCSTLASVSTCVASIVIVPLIRVPSSRTSPGVNFAGASRPSAKFAQPAVLQVRISSCKPSGLTPGLKSTFDRFVEFAEFQSPNAFESAFCCPWLKFAGKL